MLNIIRMNPSGQDGIRPKMIFEFTFDNSTDLPKDGVLNLGERIYVIANNSIAINNSTNIIYKYSSSKWIKTPDKSTSTTNTITENGSYNIPSNIATGVGNVIVDVIDSGGGSSFITKKNFNYNNEYKTLLQSIEIPNGVETISDNAFDNCSSLISVTIPNSVTSIGDSSFHNCSSLTSITIPNTITSIGNSAFNNCSALTSITIPNGVISIENYTFGNCSLLKSIIIPYSVTSIGNGAFGNCWALASITIPNNVTHIGEYAFGDCSALTFIIIPNSVETIGANVFYNCRSLASITFESVIPPMLDGELGIPKTCIIRVPQGTLSDYEAYYNYPDPSEYTYEEY